MRTNSVALGLLGALMMCVACVGPAGEKVHGAYKGSATVEGMKTQTPVMQEYKTHWVYVAPAAGADVSILLQDECAVLASVTEETSVSIKDQTCKFKNAVRELDVSVNGSGSVDASGKLSLTYTMKGSLTEIMMTHQIDYTVTFEGGVQ